MMSAIKDNIIQQVKERDQDNKVPVKYKKFIFLSSRVHPGETNSQYMI